MLEDNTDWLERDFDTDEVGWILREIGMGNTSEIKRCYFALLDLEFLKGGLHAKLIEFYKRRTISREISRELYTIFILLLTTYGA